MLLFGMLWNDSYAYTMRVPNSLMHYQGYVTRKDTNPYIIYATRKNIEGLVQKGFLDQNLNCI